MTTIYEAEHATGYEYVNTTGYEDSELLRQFDGSLRRESWKPILVTRRPVNRRQSGRPADLPSKHGSFLLRRSAVDALQDILDANGELLPLATEDGIELYVFNTRYMIDALDKERSELEIIAATQGVLIRRHVFIEEKVRDIDIFRIPIGPRQDYFSDRFVARVKAAKLKGTEFVKLWSSDDR